ncbi:MAG: 2-succinyl-5-enolpyruvyl-6-hydroxy-3-cyclohexene-1-carboxylic-acid synthase, partial [Acidimicrobiales bacterium]
MKNLSRRAAATFSATLVDEWARAGVRHAIVCPGSRSTPLALALAASEHIEVHVSLDERSGAFVTLGIGIESAMPAVLLTTSGTAAVEAHAAVVEAHQALVPLLVCTADRPPELHHVGAPQTIEQGPLYQGVTRWSVDPGVPDETSASTWRSLGARAVAECMAGPRGPGPVHLNLPFRDPLLGEPGDLPPPRSGAAPWHAVADRRAALSSEAERLLASVLSKSLALPFSRGLLVAGAGCGDPGLVHAAARALGWPVLADPRSNCRNLESRDRAVVIATADSLLRSVEFAAGHQPDVIVRLGAPPASKLVTELLAGEE